MAIESIIASLSIDVDVDEADNEESRQQQARGVMLDVLRHGVRVHLHTRDLRALSEQALHALDPDTGNWPTGDQVDADGTTYPLEYDPDRDRTICLSCRDELEETTT